MSSLRNLDEAIAQTRERMQQVEAHIATLMQWRDQATPEEREVLDHVVLERVEPLNRELALLGEALREQERIYAGKTQQYLRPKASESDQR